MAGPAAPPLPEAVPWARLNISNVSASFASSFAATTTCTTSTTNPRSLDTLAVLTALPYTWRRALAPVVQQEYFDAYLERTGSLRERISAALQYWLALVLVNAFPLPRSGTGTRPPMRFAGSLADQGYSILIFPEGRLTRDGAMEPFKPGVGLLAKRLELSVVPIHLDGLFAILSYRDRWPKIGPVRVRIGEPIHFEVSESLENAALRVEAAVRRLGRQSD